MQQWMAAHPTWTLALFAVLLVVAFVVTNHYAPGAGIVIGAAGTVGLASLGAVLGKQRR
jgi:hypothetical protein